MIIGVNCGHTLSGQPGSGAVGILNESDETRAVGIALMSLLRKGGHTVIDCTNDYAVSTSANLAQIVSMANAQTLDLFVSVHFNAGGGRGTEVYTYGGKSFAAAENVCRNMAALGFNNRGIKDGSGLYVIRRTTAQAMLIEVCFVDSADADLYKRLGAERIAEEICSALTGETAVTEYTEIKDIVRELNVRGILSDTGLWEQYCGSDANVYWFCRKLCRYVRTKKNTETADAMYEDIHDIAWDLNYRGIISDMALWEDFMKRDKNVYYLLQKGLHYCRTH